MLKHGRAGVPMEVMGLMLGEFVDDYTVRVIDVFAMPQSGTVSSLQPHLDNFVCLFVFHMVNIFKSFSCFIYAILRCNLLGRIRTWILRFQ